jgi:Glycosyl hydrolase family 12
VRGYRNGHNGKKWNCAEERGNSVGTRKKASRPGLLRIRVLLGPVLALALLAGLAGLGPAALASSGTRPSAASSTRLGPVPGPAIGLTPDGGVVGNKPYCDRDYERLSGDKYIAYNGDSGDYTCLQTTGQQHASGFRVTTFKQDIPGGVGAFPNIFAGFEWGRHPKNSFLPAKESNDGDPLVSVSVKSVPGGYYNAAYDIWFNKTDPANPWKLGGNNGTEVMIWLVNHEGRLGSGNYKIDGHSWRMVKWVAKNRRTGTTWKYIAFIAPSNMTSATLRLNPFFKAAMAQLWLSRSWYLTNIGFGFEMFSGHLAGLAVHNFSLQDMKSGTLPVSPKPKPTPRTWPKPRPMPHPKPWPRPWQQPQPKTKPWPTPWQKPKPKKRQRLVPLPQQAIMRLF